LVVKKYLPKNTPEIVEQKYPIIDINGIVTTIRIPRTNKIIPTINDL
jgi:hypothetical protein